MYSTTDNEEDINYLTNEYKDNRGPGEEPTKLGSASTVIGNPAKGIMTAPGKKAFSISPDDFDSYAKDFAGDSDEELAKYKADTQGWFSKAGNAWIGGVISGIGSFLQDAGYMQDIDTYKSMLGSMDYYTTKQLGLWDYIFPGKAWQTAGQAIKNFSNSYFPVYENPGGSTIEQTFNWANFKGVVDSAVGFGLAGMGAGKLIELGGEGLLKLLASSGKYAEAALQAGKLSKLGSVAKLAENLASKTAKVDTYVNMMMQTKPNLLWKLASETPELATSILTKGAEARMEGLDAYQTAMTNLKPLIQDGTLTQEEANSEASKIANTCFDKTMVLFALDALMLKSLFKTKSNIFTEELSNPELFSTKLKHGLTHLLGIPKEGFEEMWQQSAQEQGMFDIYKDIKGKLSNDQKLQYINKIGFDPDKMPEGFVERLGYLFDTTQARVAGLTGMLQGPMQSIGLNLARKVLNKSEVKSEHEQAIKEYRDQQEIYKNNSALFNTYNEFVNQVKEYTVSEDMRKLASTLNDDELHDIAQESSFINIVAKNFVKGTTNQLREVLEANNVSGESVKLQNLLTSFEKDYASSKRYINPMEVFTMKRNIALQQKLVDNFTRKANDEKLSAPERKSYAEGANKGLEKIQELNNNLKDITSTKSQIKLAEQYKNHEELVNVYNSLGSIDNLSQLEGLLNKYNNDPYIKERYDQVKEDHAAKKVEDNTKVQTDSVIEKVTNTVKHKAKQVANIISNQINKPVTETDVKNNSILSDEETDKGRRLENNIKLSKNNQPIQERQYLDNYLENYYKTTSNNKITPSNDDYNSFAERYDNWVDEAKTPEEHNVVMSNLAKDIYNTTANQVTGETINPEKEGVSHKVDGHINDLFNLLSLDDLSDEDIPTPEEFSKLPKNQKASIIFNTFYKIHQTAQEEGIPLFNSFKDFIGYFAKLNPELTYKFYDRLKSLYTGVTGENITDSYSEALGVNKPDYHIDPEMPFTPKEEEVREIVWINPKQSSEDLHTIYLDESVENIGSKNLFPASSFAYLSQDFMLRRISPNEVIKETSQKDVTKNNLLNPNKFNEGDSIQFQLDDYNKDTDVITLNNGDKAIWSKFLEDYNKDEHVWRVKYKLSPDEFITDYWPVTISSKEDGVVAHVHNVNWINKLNVPDGIIEDSKNILRQFKQRIVKELQTNSNTPIEGKVLGKTVDITKEGAPKGFVLNTRYKKGNGDVRLADPNLKFGIKSLTGIEVKNNLSIQNSILNLNYLPNMGYNIIYSMLPLGKKEGKMTYWAYPVFSNNLTIHQAKSIRTAIEIFVTQNENVAKEFYDTLHTSQDSIDLKTIDGVKQYLRKFVYLYNKGDKLPIEEFVKSKVQTTPTSVIEIKGDKIKVGRSTVKEYTKGQPVSKTQLDSLENNILKNMLFNVNKNTLNSTKEFNSIELQVDGKINKFTGNYNDFIKSNINTFADSVKLDDGSYAYTIQHITRFDMGTESNKVESTVQQEEVKSYKNDPQIIELVKGLDTTYDQFYEKYLSKVDQGLVSLDKVIQAVQTKIDASKLISDIQTFDKNDDNCS